MTAQHIKDPAWTAFLNAREKAARPLFARSRRASQKQKAAWVRHKRAVKAGKAKARNQATYARGARTIKVTYRSRK